jgi:hypothetical protein
VVFASKRDQASRSRRDTGARRKVTLRVGLLESVIRRQHFDDEVGECAIALKLTEVVEPRTW